jgi:hypothetical protein
VSQQVSQQKPENSNKINTFTNLGESTSKNEVSQKKELLLKEVEHREAVKTINDYLEQVKKITDKNKK